mgnify:CR=1 FL=1
MQYLFYDTCSLLSLGHKVFENDLFLISAITFKELEGIKTSIHKDVNTKFKARKILHLLNEHEDKYYIVPYIKEWDDIINTNPTLELSNDARIIVSALHIQEQLRESDQLIFITEDLSCKMSAANQGLTVKYIATEQNNYTGFVHIYFNKDEDLANFYNRAYAEDNFLGLREHQYAIIFDKDEPVDCFVLQDNHLERISEYLSLDTRMFGLIEPKDYYQLAALDSFRRNKLTVLRGAAGTGKSLLALGYLFYLKEHHQIDKIIIFCNTVATAGAAKLGFYPGDKNQKLLDSQIGNFLISKIGDRTMVEELVARGEIILMPMSDARGFDTTDMHAGIYITEAQNMDIELMRLALQRIGDDSVCILDGDDLRQVDLGMYAGASNGLRRVSEVFRGEDIYGEVQLQHIYRSKIAEIAQKM